MLMRCSLYAIMLTMVLSPCAASLNGQQHHADVVRIHSPAIAAPATAKAWQHENLLGAEDPPMVTDPISNAIITRGEWYPYGDSASPVISVVLYNACNPNISVNALIIMRPGESFWIAVLNVPCCFPAGTYKLDVSNKYGTTTVTGLVIE